MLKSKMLSRVCAVIVGLSPALRAAAPTSQPDDAVPVEKVAVNPAAQKEKAGAEKQPLLTIDGSIDWTTAYFFRGYKIENRALILQPYATVHLNILQSDELSISPYIGTWNSIHSETNDADDWQYWNESDIIGGVELSRENWSLNASCNVYTYPNGNARQTEELGIVLSYDDTDWMKEHCPKMPALNPHVGFFHELHDRNGTEDDYLEAGIEPSYEVPDTKLTLSLPVIIGTSLDSFYTNSDGHNAWFGYGSVGLKAAYALSDHWSVNLAVTYLRLEADSLVDANDGSHDVVIGTLGLGFSY